VFELALFLTLAVFSFVVSQPFFFLVALGRASETLSASAYIELRQRINAVMNRKLPLLYGAALVSALVLLGLAIARGERLVAAATGVAIAGLVADTVLAVRRNVPLNGLMDGWTASDPPADWELHRARWAQAFALRQVVLSVAWAVLLAGALASR
jgi:ABC-type iron transport system FetAB permease component